VTAPFPERPSRIVASRDGTPIAVFSAGCGPALLLVHGTTSDHRTWRTVAPELGERHTLHAIDRRGRGDSGDGPGYSIRREIEDVVAVAEALAADARGDTGTDDLLGHSLGGRIGLAAATSTAALRRVAVIESAPGSDAKDRDPLLRRLEELLAAGDDAGVLTEFMTRVVGMSAEDLDRFRTDPVWPLRVAAAPTIVRELAAADGDAAIGLETLARVTDPVLQLVGSASPAWFRDAADTLDARLADGRIVVIDGARHAPHSTHPHELVAAVEAFLGHEAGGGAGQ